MNKLNCREISKNYSELIDKSVQFKSRFPVALNDRNERQFVRVLVSEIEVLKKSILMEPRIQLRKAERVLLTDLATTLQKLLSEKKVVFRKLKNSEQLSAEESAFYNNFPREEIRKALSKNMPLDVMKRLRYFEARDESGMHIPPYSRSINEKSIGVELIFQEVPVIFDPVTKTTIHAGISIVMAPPRSSEVGFLCIINLRAVGMQ